MEHPKYKNRELTEIPQGLKREQILQDIGFRTERKYRDGERSNQILEEVRKSMGDLSKLPKTKPEERELAEKLLVKCNEAIALNDRNEDVYLCKAMLLADLASIDEDWFNSDPLIKDCITNYSQTTNDLTYLDYVVGYWDYKREKYRSAIPSYRRYLEKIKDDPPSDKVDIFFEIGYCYYMAGDYFSAISHLLDFKRYVKSDDDPRVDLAYDMISVIRETRFV